MLLVFYRWLLVKWMMAFHGNQVMLVFYTNGPVDGFIGWIEVKGYGTLAFVKPDGRFVFRW